MKSPNTLLCAVKVYGPRGCRSYLATTRSGKVLRGDGFASSRVALLDAFAKVKRR